MSTKKKQKEEKTTVISLRIGKDYLKKLDELSDQTNINRNKLISIAIRSMIEL